MGYKYFKSFLDKLSVYGSSGFLSEERFVAIVYKLKVTVAVFVFLVIVGIVYRKYIVAIFKKSLRSLLTYIRLMWDSFPRDKGLLLTIVIGVIIRLYYVDSPMRTDESHTFTSFISRPFPIIMAYYNPNNHIFFSLLSNISCAIFGKSTFALRLPAFLAGIAVIPLTYYISKKIYKSSSAILSSFLVAVSPALIGYSVNARGYTIIAMFTLILFIMIAKKEKMFSEVIFSVISVLGFYTSMAFILPFASLLLYDFIEEKNVKRIARISIGTGFLVALCYLPVIVFVGAENVEKRFLFMHVSYFKSLWCVIMQSGYTLPLDVLLAGSALVSLKKYKKLSLSLAIILFVSLLMPRDQTYERLWLYLIPFYAIIASSVKKTVILLILMLVIFTPLSVKWDLPLKYDTPTFPQAKEVTLYLKKQLVDGDVIVPCVPYWIGPLEYYFKFYDMPMKYLNQALKGKRCFFLGLERRPINDIYTEMEKRGCSASAHQVNNIDGAIIYLVSK